MMSINRNTAPTVTVTALLPEHADAVLEIYGEGIATGDATFQTTVPTWAAWDGAHLAAHRFVAVDGAEVLGFVAVSPTSARAVYAGVVEHSIYVAAVARGRGVGSALLSRLVTSTEEAGIWTIRSGVFPENTASLALHDRHGFRRVGVQERVGKLGDRWRDVVLLERRSTVAGR